MFIHCGCIRLRLKIGQKNETEIYVDVFDTLKSYLKMEMLVIYLYILLATVVNTEKTKTEKRHMNVMDGVWMKHEQVHIYESWERCCNVCFFEEAEKENIKKSGVKVRPEPEPPPC